MRQSLTTADLIGSYEPESCRPEHFVQAHLWVISLSVLFHLVMVTATVPLGFVFYDLAWLTPLVSYWMVNVVEVALKVRPSWQPDLHSSCLCGCSPRTGCHAYLVDSWAMIAYWVMGLVVRISKESTAAEESFHRHSSTLPTEPSMLICSSTGSRPRLKVLET